MGAMNLALVVVLGSWVRAALGVQCHLCMGRACMSGHCSGTWCKRSSVVHNGSLMGRLEACAA